jgi:uncharacterized protein (DUF58 family)
MNPSTPSGTNIANTAAKLGAQSRALADAMPRLVLDARRIAAGMIHGLHGRRRAGPGESFWQYRHFASGEPAQNVDWRRSGRDDHLYVREREWEAAHTVWIWPDRSASMDFSSHPERATKRDRAIVVSLALAELLVQGGERVGIPQVLPPTASRNVIDRMAQAIVHETQVPASLPPQFLPSALAEIVIVSDFWSTITEIETMLTGLAASGAHGTLVQITDPAEETFPYAGRVEFSDPEGAGKILAGRAEQWTRDYVAKVAAHRDAIRAASSKSGWRFMIHRTDRPASELLLALHQALGSQSRHAAAPSFHDNDEARA